MGDVFLIIAPVFLIMLVGFGLGKTRLFPAGSSGILIAFVWYVAIPALMFRSVAPATLPQADELLLVLGYYSALLALYALAVLVSRFVFKLSAAEQGVFALSSCFANGGFIGIPILEGAFGTEGVRLLLVILSFHSLTLLTITTIIAERANRTPGGPGVMRKTVASLGQNPLLLALVSGLSWSALGLPFPEWLDRVLALPAQSAAPTGLFAAGVAIAGFKIAGDMKQAMIAVAFKLMLLPMLVFTMTYFVLSLPDLWVGVATLTAALPTGMVAYTFGEQYGIGSRRAATTVVVSTAGSLLTLSGLLVWLGTGT